MAKRKYIDYKKAQSELFKRTEGYAANVGAAYRSALTEIINLVKGTELTPGKPFSFSEYGYSDEVTPILRSMYSRVYQIIRGGVQKEWLIANEHNDGLVKAIFGEHSIEDNHFARFFQHNLSAMNAFFARKTASGLNLSQKVWKYTGIYKDELEDALDLAIGEGTPANRLATQIQKYLNDPDRFYRRFRVKIGENEDGTPQYGRVWKRRVYDAETSSYKWIDDDPRKYHPGRGVYRSSYRNAQRLARTETNIAYRKAEFDRWQEMPFVIGIEIKLSNNHPVLDICDDLKGIYPKNFKWTGWHPNCRCYQEPVLATPAELDKMLDNILDGTDPANVDCEGEIIAPPQEFGDWVRDSKERIERATANGTLPYFIKDNKSAVENAERIAINRKEYERLKADSNYKDVEFNPANGGLKAIHVDHENHLNDKTLFFEKFAPHDLELRAQDILYTNGYSCILESEKVYDSEKAGKRFKSLDTTTQGERMDIKSITKVGNNTFSNIKKEKKKQLRGFNEAFGSDWHSLILYFYDTSMFDESKVRSMLGNTIRKIICLLEPHTIVIIQ